MFSRIKMLNRPNVAIRRKEIGRLIVKIKRRETIELEKNSMKLMEMLLRNFENFPRIYYFENQINSVI